MDYTDSQLFSKLKELNIINLKALEEAFGLSKEKGQLLADVLLGKDLITDENLGQTIADLYSLPFVWLKETSISDDILQIIPEVVAKKQKILCFRKDSKGLHLALNNPNSVEIIEFLQKKTGLKVNPYYATERDIKNKQVLYTKDLSETFEDIIKRNIKQAEGKSVSEKDIPIIKIVDTITYYAYQNRASDIHIEPQDNVSVVRFRIDGVLHDIVQLPIDVHHQIISRIKVLSKLRTDEHQAAQDGKMQVQTEDELLDIRVSIVPLTKGEKVVLRLLSEKNRQFSLSNLGFTDEDLIKVKASYEKPYGMILSTGPTGCGKTTTMYSVLKLLNERDINIMTIEDPVEYDMEGINQIQVNPKTELTFAKGLRSILRQDPNVILVGEIRDSETAGIAINAAMTGHLVLSTLHTNDASTSIPRLIDMGIEPFLVASTVNVIIAQRLIRKICLSCRASIEKSRIELSKYFEKKTIEKIFGKKDKVRVYFGKGCPICHNTGYIDRVGIFETMFIDPQIREAILARKDASLIKEISVKNGMRTMLEDGLEKVKVGITTIDEIIRVTKE